MNRLRMCVVIAAIAAAGGLLAWAEDKPDQPIPPMRPDPDPREDPWPGRPPPRPRPQELCLLIGDPPVPVLCLRWGDAPVCVPPSPSTSGG